MFSRPTTRLILLAALVIGGGTVFWYTTRQTPSTPEQSVATTPLARDEGQPAAEPMALVPAKSDPSFNPLASVRHGGGDKIGVGFMVPSGPDSSKGLSPQAKARQEAIRTHTHLERVSISVTPPAFSAAKWAADPQYRADYLSVGEPARVYQSAQPDAQVPVIAAVSPLLTETKATIPVELKVKAVAGQPVTFTSLFQASFADSGLTTTTVVADANGVATATVTASLMAIGDCTVLAASPATSGRVSLTLRVLPMGGLRPVSAAMTGK